MSAAVASKSSNGSRPQVKNSSQSKIIPTITIPQPFATILFDRNSSWLLSTILLIGELFLGILIIERVSYTEIDWIAYMQEVGGFLSGEFDYINLRGDTGPLVYPAGFVYIFAILRYFTNDGENIKLAQYIFLFFYLFNLFIIHLIYRSSKLIPPYVLILLSLSKRIHSIFVLRLFNDCLSMLFLYLAIYLIIKNKFYFSSFCFSLSLSIKMNILLFSPAYLLILMYTKRVHTVIKHLLFMLSIQIILALPFLLTAPMNYFNKAFEFSRVFYYKWTVNLKILPEEIFLHHYTSNILLGLHFIFLLYFIDRYSKNGIMAVMKHGITGIFNNAPPMINESINGHVDQSQSHTIKSSSSSSTSASSSLSSARSLSPDFVISLLFITNFIGIIFARSLHYQFYVWYFHSLPYLLTLTNNRPWPLAATVNVCDIFPVFIKLIVLFSIEIAWNIFPAEWWSSLLLIFAHLWMLMGLVRTKLPTELITNNKNSQSVKVKQK